MRRPAAAAACMHATCSDATTPYMPCCVGRSASTMVPQIPGFGVLRFRAGRLSMPVCRPAPSGPPCLLRPQAQRSSPLPYPLSTHMHSTCGRMHAEVHARLHACVRRSPDRPPTRSCRLGCRPRPAPWRPARRQAARSAADKWAAQGHRGAGRHHTYFWSWRADEQLQLCVLSVCGGKTACSVFAGPSPQSDEQGPVHGGRGMGCGRRRRRGSAGCLCRGAGAATKVPPRHAGRAKGNGGRELQPWCTSRTGAAVWAWSSVRGQ